MNMSMRPLADEVQWRDRVVLVVSPTPSHPQDYGNRKRIYRICKVLQNAGAKIHFLHYASEAEWRKKIPVKSQSAMMQEWDGYYLVNPTRELHSNPAGSHHQIDDWWDPQIETTLAWLAEKIQPDVVIVNYTWLSRALEVVPKSTLKVLDTHDKFSGRKELLASYGIAPEFFYTTEDQERIAFERADIIWAIKEEERELFSKMTTRPVLTMPHGDPASYLPCRSQPADPVDYELRVGVIGARNSINTFNLTRFLEAAKPIFRTHLPPLRIVVGGTVCDMIDEVDLPFVEKVGWVEDVEDFYRQIDVAIVPMEFSTGLKIKTAEAMTYGMPIVSHRHAFEGYTPFSPACDLASFEEMADYLVTLAFQGEGALAPLRLASNRSHAKVLEDMETAMRETGLALARANRSTLLCLSRHVTRRGSLHEVASKSSIEYLSYRSPILLYLDDAGPAHELQRFAMGLGTGRLFVNPAYRQGLDRPVLDQLEEAGVIWSTFEQVLARNNVSHLWLDSIPTRSVSVALPEFDRLYLNLGLMAPEEARAILAQDLLRDFLGPFTSVTLLSPRESQLASALREALGADAVRLLPFWGKKFPLMWDLSPLPPQNRWGVNIILERSSPAIVTAIANVARMSGQTTLNIIQLDSTEPVMSREFRRGLDLRYMSPFGIDAKTVPMLRTTRLTVDLSSDNLLGNTLSTLFLVAGHRVLTLLSMSGNGKSVLKAGRLFDFLSMLNEMLSNPAPAPDSGMNYAALTTHDPGWSFVWQHWR